MDNLSVATGELGKAPNGDFVPTKNNVLPLKTRLAYSVGHVFNDLCASIWFSYSLLFFSLDFSGKEAGGLLLLGQVADALATPYIGFTSDRNDETSLLCRYGRRKTWHLVGTLLVAVSFPFIYSQCLGCESASSVLRFLYYAAFIIIFQWAWAAVQVSHMSLITDLTPISNERVELNAYRQACNVASNLCIYLVTLAMIQSSDESHGVIGKDDAYLFGYIAYITIGVGSVFSLVFHCLVSEPRRPTTAPSKPDLCRQSSVEKYSQFYGVYSQAEASDHVESGPPKSDLSHNSSSVPTVAKKWSDWFHKWSFWQVAFIYMMSRLYFNVTQIYTPLYLQYTLRMHKDSIAIVPFVSYTTGFIFSLVARPISARLGSKVVLLCGCALALASCVWLNFGSADNEQFRLWQIYPAMALNGVGSTAILISSLAITADMIGTNTETGAFVFGTMSFFDKLINGVAVFVVQVINPVADPSSVGVMITYYRHILVYVAGSAVIMVIVGLATIRQKRLGVQQLSVAEPSPAKF